MAHFLGKHPLIKLFGLVSVLIIVVLSSPAISVLFIGGVITQGILGGFSGKVGGVVGGNWKGVDYMRGFKAPANPNTTAQQAQRAKMASMVAKARMILSTIIQVYWNPFSVKSSGYNDFVKANINLLGADPYPLTANNKIALGTLQPVAGVTAVYTTGDGSIDLTWTNNTGQGNALATDIAVAVIAKLNGSKFWVYDEEVETRSDGALGINIDTGLTATDLVAFLFFKRGTGPSLIVSDSVGDVAAAA